MSKSYKATDVSGTVEEAVGVAYGEFQSLRDEMQEWADNMDSGGLSSVPKFEEVSEAADNLSNFADEEPDTPETLKAAPVKWTEMVPKRRGKGSSRAVRLDNACLALQAVIELVDELEKTEGEDKGGFQEFRDHLDDAVGQAGDVSFPGMF